MPKKLCRWFVANSLLPILAPVIFLCIVEWYRNDAFPFGEIFMELLWGGFYVFSALALIFSLIEDYHIFKMAGIGSLQGAFLMLLVILTLYIFYLIHTEDALYIQNHSFQFILIWLLSAVSATSIKYKILKYKEGVKIK